ncbi:MAG: S46 family peptidase [Gemmatimonadota bacterium]|jgi:hypothetical protein
MIATPFRRVRAALPAGLLALVLASSAAAQSAAFDPDTIRPGRFDFGKMWTFEYAPSAYFSETYGFDASPAWFERARLSALRIPGCSASFVSPRGLVVTNHHCARGAVASVTREGEHLLDDGFYAATPEEERPIPRYYADQLIQAADVTDEILGAVDRAAPDARQEARARAIQAVRARLEARHREDGNVFVQVVPLYNGGRYSAYVFRRFTDVRLVAAAELNMGFFGGDPDNFTYPRYALDFAFYRVYVDGKPYEPEHWFAWGEGVHEGDPVFIIGNPGPTNRLQTVAQLTFQRDVYAPVRKAFYASRLQALRDAYAADPVTGERLGLRNQAFSLSNSLKAYTGRLAALRDPAIMARKAAAEAAFLDSLSADPELLGAYGGVVDDIAAVVARRTELAGEHGAFYNVGHRTYGSRLLQRAAVASALAAARAGGAPADSLRALENDLAGVSDHPGDLEEDLLALRLGDLQRYLGENDALVALALDGRSPEGAATSLLRRSVLATQERTRAALEAGGIPADDPGVALWAALGRRMAAYLERERPLTARERELAADLGRARFQVYGTDVAPDATSSPRITDGVVKGYEYNGTLAPTHTTFYGVYDRYYGHEGNVDWQLPDRWVPPPEGLDLSTPLNFVSTADTYGGNSGSPAVTRELALVGLNFDRNIEGLSRDFIYLPDRGRNIMVDVRAIREALEKVYGARRIVDEITAGSRERVEAEGASRGGGH